MAIVHPQSLFAHLAPLPDPRRKHGQRYSLMTVLGLLVLASLNGTSSLRGMWRWGRNHWATIRRGLACPAATAPSYGTLWQVLATLDGTALEECLGTWVQQVIGALVPSVSADAKTLRGSRRVADQLPGLQLLSLVAHDLDVVLHHLVLPAGGDPLDGLSTLVRDVPVTGHVLRLDAGLLHARATQAVAAQDGYDLGPVKDNAPVLNAAIDQQLQEHLAGTIGPRRAPDAHSHDKGHGRQEARWLWVEPAAPLLRTFFAQEYGWQNMQQIGLIRRQQRRHRAAPWTEDEPPCGTNLPAAAGPPEKLVQLLRAQWGIENRSQWVRDVTYQEDRQHARRWGPALASLRNTAIAIIRVQDFAYVPDGHAFVSAHLSTALSWLRTKLTRVKQN